MTRVLEAQGIEKVFLNGDEETRVLKGIDLTLDKGELAALLGASGSGKSTLLSIIGLLLRPTAGRLTISGEPVDQYSEKKRGQFRNRRLGFVFQFHHLLPDFTALENVAFPAAAPAGGISRDMRDRARGLLTRVGLEDRIDFPAVARDMEETCNIAPTVREGEQATVRLQGRPFSEEDVLSCDTGEGSPVSSDSGLSAVRLLIEEEGDYEVGVVDAEPSSEWSKITGISRNTINQRLKKKWTINDALTIPPRYK